MQRSHNEIMKGLLILLELPVAQSTSANRINAGKAGSDPKVMARLHDSDSSSNNDEDGEDGTGDGDGVPVGRASYAPTIRSRRTLAALLRSRPPDLFCPSPWEPPSLAPTAPHMQRPPGLEHPLPISGKPWPAGRARTDMLCHRHPPNPGLPSIRSRKRCPFPPQPAALTPNPLLVQPNMAPPFPCLPDLRPISSSDLEPDPLAVANWPPRIEFWLTAVLLSCPGCLSGTEVLGFRCPPDPRLREVAATIGALAFPSDTTVLSFQHPPNP